VTPFGSKDYSQFAVDIDYAIVYTLGILGYMKTIINIKTDKNVKQNAQRTAERLGLSLSAVLNAYLRQFIRNKEVHFSIVPRMSPELENLLGSIEYDIQRNRNISKSISNEKELKNYFKSL